MKTLCRTTYILLERGSEDLELLRELNQIFYVLGKDIVLGLIIAAKSYPKLFELREGLKKEVNTQHE